MSVFGLQPLRAEGGPIHPDDPWYLCGDGSLSDSAYLNQLQAYKDFFGWDEARRITLSRPEMMEKLK
jgi:hypothetical protein